MVSFVALREVCIVVSVGIQGYSLMWEVEAAVLCSMGSPGYCWCSPRSVSEIPIPGKNDQKCLQPFCKTAQYGW